MKTRSGFDSYSAFEDVTSILTDAQEMMRNHPATFEAPTLDELSDIKPGMGVKICATGPHGGERFWTLVQSVEGDVIHATVDSHLERFDWPVGKKCPSCVSTASKIHQHLGGRSET